MRTHFTRSWCLPSALALALLGASAAQAQVSKWVDEKGAVHYGDVVPDKYRTNAKAMTLRNDAPSPAEQREAQLRLQQATESQRVKRSASAPAAPAVIDAAVPPTETDGLSCAEQWKVYRQAQECFGPYKNANGSVKVEALAQCPLVKEPTNCTARNAEARR
ncbi:DUF4124 domain-containing protein [Ralstonia sp. CHL-2022]|uniref:DUF4124 domain-containing protein n=1 Tax=Ralstonia mojiangensis TaxID=2953895 RepID=A0ABT2L7P5_9RALS|nr:DUF4124 domain-containing protein [Ralstonia mojiangensis]MCT7296705.1 DUF4124 domain-containing protein [Ralstonia mojiangensis]MCT7311119.1 DUF4124 domain-containing protein [Ralstonia mojiangensis]